MNTNPASNTNRIARAHKDAQYWKCKTIYCTRELATNTQQITISVCHVLLLLLCHCCNLENDDGIHVYCRTNNERTSAELIVATVPVLAGSGNNFRPNCAPILESARVLSSARWMESSILWLLFRVLVYFVRKTLGLFFRLIIFQEYKK